MSISSPVVRIDEFGSRVGRRPTGGADGSDRPDEALAAVQRCAVADGAELGHAVPLHHATTEAVGDRVAQVLVQRCRARQHRAQCRQVVVVHQRMLGQSHRDRRRDVGDAHLVGRDVGEELLEIEAGHHHKARPRMQNGVEQHRHSVDVEERHDRDHDVVGLHVLHRAGLRDVGDQVAVGEHHALRVARRARAVGQHREVGRGIEADLRCLAARTEKIRRAGVAVDAVEHDQLVVGHAHRGGGLLGLGQQRADGDEHLGLGVRQLLDDVLRGEQHVDRGGRRTGAQDAVKGDREGGAVRRQQPDHVPDGDAAVGQRACERLDLRNDVAVAGFVARLRIHQRDAVGVSVVDVAEQVLVDAGVRDVDVGERAREAHGLDRTTPLRRRVRLRRAAG